MDAARRARLLTAVREGDSTAAAELVVEARRRDDAALELELIARVPACGSFARLATRIEQGHGDLAALAALLDAHWPDAKRVVSGSRLRTWLAGEGETPRWLPLVRAIEATLRAEELLALAGSPLAGQLRHLALRFAPVFQDPPDEVIDTDERYRDHNAEPWSARALHALLGKTRLHGLRLALDDHPYLADNLAAALGAVRDQPLAQLELAAPLRVLGTCLHALDQAPCAATLERVSLRMLAASGLYQEAALAVDDEGRDELVDRRAAPLARMLAFLTQPALAGLRALELELDGDWPQRRSDPRPPLARAIVRHLGQLERLSLCDFGLDDGDVQALVAMPHRLAALRELRLEVNELAASALPVLARLPRLERLSLRCNRIEAVDLDALEAAPALRELDLSQNPLPDALRERIRAHQDPIGAARSGPQRVEHAKFGPGEVLAIDGETVQVRFEREGEKKIRRRFLSFVAPSLGAPPPRVRIVV